MLQKIFFYNHVVFGIVSVIMAVNVVYLAYPYLDSMHYKGIAVILAVAIACFLIAATKNRLDNVKYIILSLISTSLIAFIVSLGSPKISGFAIAFVPAMVVLLVMLIRKQFSDKESKNT